MPECLFCELNSHASGYSIETCPKRDPKMVRTLTCPLITHNGQTQYNSSLFPFSAISNTRKFLTVHFGETESSRLSCVGFFSIRETRWMRRGNGFSALATNSKTFPCPRNRNVWLKMIKREVFGVVFKADSAFPIRLASNLWPHTPLCHKETDGNY